MLAAIDVENFAGHKRGRFEVEHRIDNLLNFPEALHGMQAGKGVVHFGGVHGRSDDAGGDRIDPHP